VISGFLPEELDFVSFSSPLPIGVATATYNPATRYYEVTFNEAANNSLAQGSTIQFSLQAIFPGGSLSGISATNTINATSTNATNTSASSTVNLGPGGWQNTPGDFPDAKYGDSKQLQGGYQYWQIEIGNIGFSDIDNYQIFDVIPNIVTLDQVRTPVIPYVNHPAQLYYKRSDDAVNWYLWTNFNLITRTTRNVSGLGLPAGIEVSEIRFDFGTVPASPLYNTNRYSDGFNTDIILYGIIDTPLADGVTFTNCADYTGTSLGSPISDQACTTTIIDSSIAVDRVSGTLDFADISGAYTTQANIGDTIKANYTYYNSPEMINDIYGGVLSIVLPAGMSFVPGTLIEEWVCTHFDGYSPIIETGTTVDGREIVRFVYDASFANEFIIEADGDWDGCGFYFDVVVGNSTFEGNNRGYYYFNATGSTHTECTDLDTENYLNGYAANYCSERYADIQIIIPPGSAGVRAEKEVIGTLDGSYTQYPATGTTVPGGLSNYRISITNPNVTPIDSIEIIDILPYIGDTDILDPSTSRFSQWQPNLAAPITPPAGVTVYYATVANPCRDELAGANPSPFPTGCNTANWSALPPTDITSVTALKYELYGITLNQNDSITLEFDMRAPVDAPTGGEVSWNSFAYIAHNATNGSSLLPTEAIKVGIKTQAGTIPIVGDYVWEDANANGLQDGGEPGIDGVRIGLYADTNGNNIPDPGSGDIEYTWTISANGGQYIFSDFPLGDYFLVFSNFPSGYVPTYSNVGANDNLDSDSDTTGVIMFTGTTDLNDVDFGLYNGSLPLCDASLSGSTDTDGDNVADVCDLDDDNDGILDTDECAATVIVDFEETFGSILADNGTDSDLNLSTGDPGYNAVSLSTSSTSTASAIYLNGPKNAPGSCNNGTITDNFFGQTDSGDPGDGFVYHNTDISCSNNDDIAWYNLVPITVTPNTEYTFTYWSRGGDAVLSVVVDEDASDGANNFIAQGSAYTVTLSWVEQTVSFTTGISTTSIFVGIENATAFGSGNDFGLDQIRLTHISPCIDTDGDGIPDYLDLDSDNDGCSDAIEGGTTTDQTTNFQFAASPNVDGVSTAASAFNNTTDFRNAAVTSCDCPFASGIDTDGDGVDDTCDLDDDNDGILDEDECQIETSGFESFTGNSGDQISPYPDNSVASPWSAVNIDGEIWASGGGFNAYDGTYYIELLQNEDLGVGMNDKSYWDESSYAGSGGYDRIVNLVDVTPNTAYVITYYHQDGGRLVPSYGDGGTTLLQVQSMNSAFAVSQETVTPTNWTEQTFSFTTDASTTQIAILFSTFADLNVSIQLDLITISGTLCDLDMDGILNHLDLDSDGDGCPDAIEGDGSYTNTDLVTSSIDGGNIGAGYIGTAGPIQENLGTSSNADGTPTLGPVQGVGASQDAKDNLVCCADAANYGVTDTDVDNIGDACDLDDDNDGILDTIECVEVLPYGVGTSNFIRIHPDSFGLSAESPAGAPYTSFLATTGPVDISDDFGYPVNSGHVILTVNNARQSSGAGWVTGLGVEPDPPTFVFSGTTPVKVVISHGPSITSGGTQDGFTSLDGVVYERINPITLPAQWTDVSSGTYYGVLNNTAGAYNPGGANRDAYVSKTFGFHNFEVTSTDNSGSNNIESGFHLWAFVCDYDLDGLNNLVDLDSDGDGCPDALEGDGSYTHTDLVASSIDGGNTGAGYTGTAGPVQDNLGTSSNADGTPTAGLTQGIGISQDSSSNACIEICNNNIDDDGDGLIDCLDGDCGLLNISTVVVGPCIDDPLADRATLDVTVDWNPAYTNDVIEISIYRKTEYIDIDILSSPQTVSFNIPADSSVGDSVIVTWQSATNPCIDFELYNAPAPCSSDSIMCNILYLCSFDKPYDGDSWDHGWLEYLDGINGDALLTPVVTKNEPGLGLYDAMDTAMVANIDFDLYDIIIISATTEFHISNDLVDTLKNLKSSILNSNQGVTVAMGYGTSTNVAFQDYLYTDDLSTMNIYNFDNLNPTGSMVFTGSDVISGGDAYLWMYGGGMTGGTNGSFIEYEANDSLPIVGYDHGKRVLFGYHMNGVYGNPVNGGTTPVPASGFFDPIRHLTGVGKIFFDQAIISVSNCEVLCKTAIMNPQIMYYRKKKN